MADKQQEQPDFSHLNSQGHLKVSDIHEIWYGECGNKEGVPVLNLHGGPGSVSKPEHKEKFDLGKVWFIQSDQRGAGQSRPAGETEDNTTADLIEDIEKLREHLGIEKWVVSGGSWGSALALLYAETYPDRVLGLALDSVFLARKEDFDWLGRRENAGQFYPDIWEKTIQKYLDHHEIKQDQFNDYAFEKISNGTLEEQKEATATIRNWEYNLMFHENDFKLKSIEDINGEEINSSKIYLHYERNLAFLKPNQIIEDIKNIEATPAAILHSRFDMVCPLNQAYSLTHHLQNLKFEIVNAHGHHFGGDGVIVRRYLFADLINNIVHG